MLQKIDIVMLVTPVARAQILKLLGETKAYPAVPALLWSRDTDSQEQRWIVGFYDRRVVEGDDFLGVLLNVGDLEFVSSQGHLIANLQGMQLDWQDNQFVVVSPAKH